MHNAMKPKSFSYSSKWEKRKETHTKQFFEKSRMWQNHYDPSVHGQPWIAPGKQPDHHWIFDDSGLIPDQYQDSQWAEQQVLKQSINQKLEKMRKFKEYELIQEDEYLITIEYCQHKSSTRHDEAKYRRVANRTKQTILQNFPNVQVVLKPLIISGTSKVLHQKYLQKRLGCCEVQLCHKKRGQNTQNINYTLFKLHSKLETKSWPKQRSIIAKLQKQMPKFIFYVQIQAQGTEQLEEFDEENEEFSKLKDITVSLVPYRDSELCQADNDPNMTNMSMSRASYRVRTAKGPRPVSGKIRPISAYSNMSNRPMSGYNRRPMTSNVPVNKSRPMTGMSQKSRRGKKKKKLQIISEKTDARGIAVFDHVSLDVYVVKIKANQNFCKEAQMVNLFELHETSAKHHMTTTIKVRSQQMAFCHIKLIAPCQIEDRYEFVPVQNADVQLYPDTPEENEERASIVKEKRQEPGVYSVVLDPGFYWFVVNALGYAQRKERITLKKGKNDIQFELEEQKVEEIEQGQEGVVALHLFDAFSKEAIEGATVTLKDTNKNKVFEAKSNRDGQCKVETDTIKYGRLSIQKEGYLLIKEEINPIHLTFEQLQNIAFPMIKKPEGENDVRVVFFSQDGTRKLDLQVIDPTGQTHNTTNNQQYQQQGQNGDADNGTSIITLKNVNTKQGIYRFYANILDSTKQSERFKIFYFNCDTVKVIESPFLQKPAHLKYWDLGFINAPNNTFIEINAFTNTKQITQDLYLSDYYKLCQFLNNSTKNQSFTLDKLLGFTHPQAICDGNDRLVKKSIIKNGLEKYLVDKIDDDFLDHILYSGYTSRGVYSFQKLRLKLKKAMEASPFAELPENEEEDLEGDDEEIDYIE